MMYRNPNAEPQEPIPDGAHSDTKARLLYGSIWKRDLVRRMIRVLAQESS